MKISRREFGRIAAYSAVTGAGLLAGGLPCPAIAQKKVFTMRFGTQFPVAHPAGARVVEVCDLIRKETNGLINITAAPNNQLGGESDVNSQVRSGAVEFSTTSGAVLQTVVPTSGISAMPFLFKDYDKVWSTMDGILGDYIRSAIAKYGIYVFPKAIDNGFRCVTSSIRPIHTVDDLKGLKIRVPVTPLWVNAFKALGAAPVALNLPELYSALQTKVVDGQENPMVMINSFRFYEVQKYCSLTRHVWDGNFMIANAKKWEALPKEIQEIISRNFAEAAIKQRADTFKMNNDLVGEMSAKGLTFNEVEPEPFRQALVKAGFYTEWKVKYGPEAWNALEKALNITLG